MDVFEQLEQLDAKALVRVLQKAGARDNIPAGAGRNDLLATARAWAVTPAREQRLREALAGVGGSHPGHGRSLMHPFAAREKALAVLGNEFSNAAGISAAYIEPDVQTTCPTDHREATAPLPNRLPAFRYVADFIAQPFLPDAGRRCLFILGDAGMGKTSLLVMLKVRHLSAFFPPRYGCELLKLGRDTLARIANLPDPSRTVLLLDSLDEDPLAREHAQGVAGRLNEIMAQVGNFHRVIITCRTQFFLQGSATLGDPGYVKLGEHKSPLRYLALFSDAQVEQYLRRRFPRTWCWPFREHPQLAPARAAARAMQSLSLRPLLLMYIQDFVSSGGQPDVDYHNSYAVHYHLTAEWLRREATKRPDEGPGLPAKEGWQVSVALAVHLARHDLALIPRADLLAIPALRGIDQFKLETRSLVTRTADNHYLFAHRTIQEFLLAHAILDPTIEADLEGIRLPPEASVFLLDGWRAKGRQRLNLRGAVADPKALFSELQAQFGILMTGIAPGRFIMGSHGREPGRSPDEGPQHEVTICQGFWLGTTPVTQAQYRAVTGATPSHHQGADLPVTDVSWEDATQCCKRLNEWAREYSPGWEFRLPTEAEWEFACRAGTSSAFHNGSACTEPTGCDPALDRLGWYAGNSDLHLHSVGTKTPNAWGLYDMHGNVWEWCADPWHDNYLGAPANGAAWVEAEAGAADHRVVRGGSCCLPARYCRAACRFWRTPAIRNGVYGFRLCCAPSSAAGSAGRQPAAEASVERGDGGAGRPPPVAPARSGGGAGGLPPADEI